MKWFCEKMLCVSLGLLLCFGASLTQARLSEADLKSKINKMAPEITVDRFEKSVLPGFMRVYSGTNIFFISEDGRFFIPGDVLDFTVSDRQQWNLAENQRRAARLKILSMLDPAKMIIYAPESPKKATIMIFTDLDCGYCQKLHQEVPKLNALGIEVRYLAFPRGGAGSKTFEKSISVWCHDDPKTAMSQAKARKKLPQKTCDHPVLEHFELAKRFEIRSTPTIIFDDGSLHMGYVSAEPLAKKAIQHADLSR